MKIHLNKCPDKKKILTINNEIFSEAIEIVKILKSEQSALFNEADKVNKLDDSEENVDLFYDYIEEAEEKEKEIFKYLSFFLLKDFIRKNIHLEENEDIDTSEVTGSKELSEYLLEHDMHIMKILYDFSNQDKLASSMGMQHLDMGIRVSRSMESEWDILLTEKTVRFQ